MDKIILLIGASGTGKTTIAKELEKEYNIIQSYTTRRPRVKNEWGHIFINHYLFCEVKDYEDTKKLITITDMDENQTTYIALAYMEYYLDIYFITKEQYKNKGTSIYIVDPEGAEYVYENIKDASIMAIYLTCDKNERMYRMLERNDSLDSIMFRMKKDMKVFRKCKCDFVVDSNRKLELVVEEVRNIIENERI